MKDDLMRSEIQTQLNEQWKQIYKTQTPCSENKKLSTLTQLFTFPLVVLCNLLAKSLLSR